VELIGRSGERAAIDDLVASAREGMSGALVIRGEAGCGKSTLLDYATSSGSDLRILRISGVQAETSLGFAGLQWLLAPLVARMSNLPARQQEALDSALGVGSQGPADLFLVGLATLTLLADSATEKPLLCLLDDAHWLDRESLEVLAFVGRRLHADGVAMLFAVRDPPDSNVPLAGLSDLRLSSFSDDDSHALLSATNARIIGELALRIVANAGGNPLAIVELASEATSHDTPAHWSVAEPLPIGERLEGRFSRQLRPLPRGARMVLLVAAAESSGNSDVVWRAIAKLGLTVADADTAVASGIITMVPRVRFRHPLIRSAVYGAAHVLDRRRVHLALAYVMSEMGDADRRAAHLAAAAAGPDEAVALELEASAHRARARGGYSAESELLERAAELSPALGARGTRLLAAAEAALQGGMVARAQSLLEAAVPLLTDPYAMATARRVDGRLHLALGRYDVVPSLLLSAAFELQPFDVEAARDTMLDAMEAARVAMHRARPVNHRDIAEAARHRHRPEGQAPTIAELLLDGLAEEAAVGFVSAVSLLRRALVSLCEDDIPPDELIRWGVLGLWIACHIADELRLHQLLERVSRHAREFGALQALRMILFWQAEMEIYAGRFDAAEALQSQGLEIAAAIDGDSWEFLTLELLAWRGDDETRSIADRLGIERESFTAGIVLLNSQVYLARLELASMRYEEAFSAARLVTGADLPFGGDWRALPDLIEAAVRTGRIDAARLALGELEERARACATAWSAGLLARSRALLASGSEAEALYTEGIDAFEATGIRTELARTHLLFGEWLFGEGSSERGRRELETARTLFVGMGAKGFARRAGALLGADAPALGQRTQPTDDRLTAQEAHIAELAAKGATNAEIATELFISASTVDYHLRKVFKKLAITSRRQLATLDLRP
jgi:DNA-binding CsgD family transcriptional regulator